jgi:hypothetical protein
VFAIDEGMDLLVATGFANLCAASRLSIVWLFIGTDGISPYGQDEGRDQFKEGLNVLGFLDVVKMKTDLQEPFFIHRESIITAGSRVHVN